MTQSLWLHRFAAVTAVATLCLIVAGALVTSNDAGLSVPDWPLSYGQLMPPMIGGVFYEHGHRMIASFVGLLTVILSLWLWRAEPRRWVRWLGVAALLAVVLQGVLGGLTVLFLLPLPVSVGHACLAQIFFAMTVILAYVTSPHWSRLQEQSLPDFDDGSPSFQHLCLAANIAILAQLALGAAFRHKGFGIVPHLIGAALVAALVIWIVVRAVSRHAGDPWILRWAMGLNGLLMLQLLLGAAAYWIRAATQTAPQPLPPMVMLTVAHVAGGALLLAASVVLTMHAYTQLSASARQMRKERVAAAT